MTAQVTQTVIGRPTEEDVTVEREVKVACDSAKAVLSGILSEGHDELTIAQNAVLGLIEALERDTVRADIARQVQYLEDAPETLDRLEASVAAERTRTPSGL
jgi:hypothetical protein